MNTLQHIVQTSPKPRKEIAKNTKIKNKKLELPDKPSRFRRGCGGRASFS